MSEDLVLLEPRQPETTALTVAPLVPDLAGDPVVVYLARLTSKKSRVTMRGALAVVAVELGAANPHAIPWAAVRHPIVAVPRDRLVVRAGSVFRATHESRSSGYLVTGSRIITMSRTGAFGAARSLTGCGSCWGFSEGDPVYAGSRIFRETHIQIAVRSPACIPGVFRPVLAGG